MEFPKIGLHCSVESCKENDFLPTNCTHCSKTFCKNHFHFSTHNCTEIHENIVPQQINSTKYYICSHNSCVKHSPVEIICIKCNKHHCLTHRHHGCLESSNEEIVIKSKQWEKPKEEFAIAKNTVDALIAEKLKKSKHINIANKIQLMKMKGRAIGSDGIPTADRRYFVIHPPISAPKKHSQAIYVYNQWTVGRTIDAITDILGVHNLNNIANSKKLRLFHQSNGHIIANKMDIVLSDLFNDGTLIDGENLILEYSNEDEIDFSLYK